MNPTFLSVTQRDVEIAFKDRLPPNRSASEKRLRRKAGFAFHTVTQHAVDALLDDLDPEDMKTGRRSGKMTSRQSWLALHWLWYHGRNANDYETQMLKRQFEAEVYYRICDCCWGIFLMVIKRGAMVTCFELKYWLKDKAA